MHPGAGGREPLAAREPSPSGRVGWGASTISLKVRPATVSTSVAPGPPRVAVAVNGFLFAPAPRPVTEAEPFMTAVSPAIRTELIVPVTYITFVRKLPLPGFPAGATGASARHSKPPSPPRKEKANFVIMGLNSGAPVPPRAMVVPAPRIAGSCFAVPAWAESVNPAARPAAGNVASQTLSFLLLTLLSIRNSSDPWVVGGAGSRRLPFSASRYTPTWKSVRLASTPGAGSSIV